MLKEQHDWVTHQFGWLQALEGSYSQAIVTLESVPISAGTSPISLHAQQALAWAYLKTGEHNKAMTVLRRIDDLFQEEKQRGTLATFRTLHNWGPYLYALNTQILGEDERALNLLQEAIDGGWRNYYICHHDPRWDAVRGNPRFRQMMADVKNNVDTQRAELERTESPDDFVKNLDQRAAGTSLVN